MKWKIIKEKEAKKLKIRTLRAGPDTYLVIDVTGIPVGLSIPDFIENIQRSGIVFISSRRRKHKKHKR